MGEEAYVTILGKRYSEREIKRVNGSALTGVKDVGGPHHRQKRGAQKKWKFCLEGGIKGPMFQWGGQAFL